MKRLTVFCILMILSLIITVFCQTAVDPADFTGKWYASHDQSVYWFQEGLIHCSEHTVPISESESISGAYSFCGNSIFLFAKGIDDLEAGKVLYLFRNGSGSFLCEKPDGSGNIYFIRYYK